MKLNDWLLGIACVIGLSATLGWISERDARVAMADRQVMCQINQHGSIHLIPCRLVQSYLAEVSL